MSNPNYCKYGRTLNRNRAEVELVQQVSIPLTLSVGYIAAARAIIDWLYRNQTTSSRDIIARGSVYWGMFVA